METMKLNILNHICSEIYRVGSIHINDAGLVEHPYQLIKMLYRQKAKRKAVSVQQNISCFNTQRSTLTSNQPGNIKEIMNDQGNMSRTRAKECVKKDEMAC